MKIRKAIIPAAGLGTRFLPATKAQPKEMLPLIDKPTIQYIVEEAVASGISEIAIIIGRGKQSIENHFDKSYELEDVLARKNQLEVLKDITDLSKKVTIYYVRQREPLGLGHAILCAKSFIGNEPFAVMLGDDIVEAKVPCLKQLIHVFEEFNSSVVAVQKVNDHEVSKYGIIKPKGDTGNPNLFGLDSLVEKPARDVAPSNYAIIGRYVFQPEIFEKLEGLPVIPNKELQLTDAINELNKHQTVYAYSFEGTRYDMGDKLGFVKATLDFALRREEMRDMVLEYIRVIYESMDFPAREYDKG